MEIPLLRERDVAIATMHGKERVIAPLLEAAFGMQCIVSGVNTDQLGTFSGEVERILSPLDAARQKCFLAMEITGYDMAIASEGSFGAHPTIPFAQANEEVVFLIDNKTGAEFVGRTLTTKTNMSGEQISTYAEALRFARRIGFPRHGMILRREKDSRDIFLKGISDLKVFRTAILEFLDQYNSLWLETDMRAMYNPTRMEAIAEATENLIKRLRSECPDCSYPNYWIDQVVPGLPCSQCGLPTRSTLGHKYLCKNCDHQALKYFPNKKMEEEPMYCDHCNP